jgi:hypothetical protein
MTNWSGQTPLADWTSISIRCTPLADTYPTPSAVMSSICESEIGTAEHALVGRRVWNPLWCRLQLLDTRGGILCGELIVMIFIVRGRHTIFALSVEELTGESQNKKRDCSAYR